jgi:hypothetical protein
MEKRLFDVVDEIDFKVWNAQRSYINEHMDVKLTTLWSYLDEWNLYKNSSETHGILFGLLSMIKLRKIWMKVTIWMNMTNWLKV